MNLMPDQSSEPIAGLSAIALAEAYAAKVASLVASRRRLRFCRYAA